MTPRELDAAARKLYEAADLVAPKWDQLGDVTKSVWMDYVRAGKTPADYARPVASSPPPTKRTTRRKTKP